jgi:tellurite resistance protein TerC
MTSNLHNRWWLAFLGLVGLLVAFDLGVMNRKRSVIEFSTALWLSLFYVVIAFVFGAWVFHKLGEEAGYQFLTGYLIEKSLSLDNLFVFLLIFSYFNVPGSYQHRVLYWGILGALILRGIVIGLGTGLVAQFHWVLYLFGAFLIYTGIKMLLVADEEPDIENNKILAFLRKHMRISEEFDAQKFFTRINGKRFFTPLFLVLILVEISDVIFALDSLPTIFAISQDPFIIFTSNIFAILGLRALFFALAAILYRFEYLKYGLSLVLVVIGGKMILNEWFDKKLLSEAESLMVTAGILVISFVISWVKTRNEEPETADVKPHGWVPGSPPKDNHST